MTTDPNQRTVAAYERYARQYADAVPVQPSARTEAALRRFVAALPPHGPVLEIGSGPGWDADFVESLGRPVHRTDATVAFRVLQRERGHQVDALDLLHDPIPDPGQHAGILLLCVLQHFEREHIDHVFAKLATALRPGGVLLLSHPIGDDAVWEHGTSGDYRVVRWPADALDAHLVGAGLTPIWQAPGDDYEGPWRSVLAQRLGLAPSPSGRGRG